MYEFKFLVLKFPYIIHLFICILVLSNIAVLIHGWIKEKVKILKINSVLINSRKLLVIASFHKPFFFAYHE